MQAEILAQTMSMTDRYVLGLHTSLKDVGVYSIGTTISSIVKLLPVAYGTAWMPFAFSSMERTDVRQVFARAVRFRSEYHYAVFENWRSAKVLRYLERGGLTKLGRVLDDGCGGGGMCVSIGEEAESDVGIDLSDRFMDAGTKLAVEKGVRNVRFAQANGQMLPFASASFDTVFSHAVIEAVADAPAYLQEIRRVLRPGGRVFLQTSPYLAPAGAHLPRLKIRVPFYLFMPRAAAFRLSCWLGAHAPWALDAPPESSSFITMAKRGQIKRDDLLYLVTVRNLRDHIAAAGFRVMREDLYVNSLAKRWLPARVSKALPRIPSLRDILVTNQEYLLAAV